MKEAFAILMIILGIVLGIYIGLYVMFIGGIYDVYMFVFNTFKTSNKLEMWMLGKGILKIIFAGIAGWTVALFLIIPGYLKLK